MTEQKFTVFVLGKGRYELEWGGEPGSLGIWPFGFQEDAQPQEGDIKVRVGQKSPFPPGGWWEELQKYLRET